MIIDIRSTLSIDAEMWKNIKDHNGCTDVLNRNLMPEDYMKQVWFLSNTTTRQPIQF